MNRNLPATIVATLFIIFFAFAVGAQAKENHKITICHIPPGNPTNAHEITIDRHALPAHLAHGDNIGKCAVNEPTPTNTPAPTSTPEPTPTATSTREPNTTVTMPPTDTE